MLIRVRALLARPLDTTWIIHPHSESVLPAASIGRCYLEIARHLERRESGPRRPTKGEGLHLSANNRGLIVPNLPERQTHRNVEPAHERHGAGPPLLHIHRKAV